MRQLSQLADDLLLLTRLAYARTACAAGWASLRNYVAAAPDYVVCNSRQNKFVSYIDDDIVLKFNLVILKFNNIILKFDLVISKFDRTR